MKATTDWKSQKIDNMISNRPGSRRRDWGFSPGQLLILARILVGIFNIKPAEIRRKKTLLKLTNLDYSN